MKCRALICCVLIVTLLIVLFAVSPPVTNDLFPGLWYHLQEVYWRRQFRSSGHHYAYCPSCHPNASRCPFQLNEATIVSLLPVYY
jgi:hypothetical protein